MLTDDQRGELESFGSTDIRMKVAAYAGGHTGPGSFIGGFRCGDIERRDIDGWLSEKTHEESKQQSKILLWAKIAAWAAIVSVFLTALGIYL
jgi:hypothetical protein